MWRVFFISLLCQIFTVFGGLHTGNCQNEFEKYCSRFEVLKEQKHIPKIVLNIFSRLTGENMGWTPLLVKLQLATFLKRTLKEEFSTTFAKLLRTGYFPEYFCALCNLQHYVSSELNYISGWFWLYQYESDISVSKRSQCCD